MPQLSRRRLLAASVPALGGAAAALHSTIPHSHPWEAQAAAHTAHEGGGDHDGHANFRDGRTVDHAANGFEPHAILRDFDWGTTTRTASGRVVREWELVALDREIESPNGFPISGVLQTDAAINPGNSGGPLLDAEGKVIGVNSQIASSSRQSSGVGFAVPVDTVKEIVPQLLKGGEIKRAYLGVSTAPETGEDGAVVVEIRRDGPAATTDLRQGDRIVELSGRAIKEPGDLSSAVLEHKPGETVQLTVERNGDRRTIDVKLGTRPDAPTQLEQG